MKKRYKVVMHLKYRPKERVIMFFDSDNKENIKDHFKKFYNHFVIDDVKEI